MTSDRPKCTPTGEYEVGYGRPPKEHQWKPGQSGRTTGKGSKKRPKKVADINQLLREQMQKTIEIHEDGKQVTISMMEVLARRITHHVVSGTPAQSIKIFKELYALGVLNPRPEDFEPNHDAVAKLVERLGEEFRREQEAEIALGRRGERA